MKAAVGATGLITLLGEDCRASRVRENLMHGSYGEGLETGRCQAPRQSFTRQIFFGWWKRHLHVYHLIARTPYGVMVQMLAGLITYLLLAIYCYNNYREKVSIRRVRELRIKIRNTEVAMMERDKPERQGPAIGLRAQMQEPNRTMLDESIPKAVPEMRKAFIRSWATTAVDTL